MEVVMTQCGETRERWKNTTFARDFSTFRTSQPHVFLVVTQVQGSTLDPFLPRTVATALSPGINIALCHTPFCCTY